jgi:hypothetical protein
VILGTGEFGVLDTTSAIEVNATFVADVAATLYRFSEIRDDSRRQRLSLPPV